MKKRFYFRIILCIVLVLGIGFALITSNLSITGTSKLKGQTWNVYFDNLVSNSTLNNSATIENDNETIFFNLDLNQPGEDYTFYFDVFNDGTLDAMLDTIEVQGIAPELRKYMDITTTYVDGVEVSKYDLLEVGASETIKMNLKYSQNININELPQQDLSLSFALAVKYEQSDNHATQRQTGTVDENAPVLTTNVTTTGENNTWKKSVSVAFHIADDDILKNVKYCVSNTTCTPNTNATVENNVFTYPFTSSENSQKVCVSATDIFGNTSSSCSANYLVDGQNPQLTTLNTTVSGNSIVVEVTGSDEISGISTYYYSNDGGQTYISSANSSYTFDNLAAGSYDIYSYVEDEAGNISNVEYETQVVE